MKRSFDSESITISEHSNTALERILKQQKRTAGKEETHFYDSFITDCKKCLKTKKEAAYVTRKEDIDILKQEFPDLITVEVMKGIYMLTRPKEKRI